MTATATTVENLFEVYRRCRSEIITVAQRQREVLSALSLEDGQSDGATPIAIVEQLIRRLESERLRVLVIGRFSAGKSTFINALLGERVLPASPTPTTGVLCEIHYADENYKKATLFPKPGMGPDGGSEPFEVLITNLQTELAQYVKIDYRSPQLTSRYDRLELCWPLRLCEHGVDLIDTIGLDDPDSRDRITMEQTSTADAVLYCMKSQDAYSARDKQVIGFLHSLGYRSILFVITHWDHVKASIAKGETTEQGYIEAQRANLVQWTELKEEGIIFVDSQEALDGRMVKDYEKVSASGIERLEEVLQRFLTEEKGRAKLLTALWTLRTLNGVANRAIPVRVNLWQTGVAELERRYREAAIPLQSLEHRRRLMVADLEIAATDLVREAVDLASRHLLDLPDRIKVWAMEYKIEGGLVFPPTKKNIQPIVEELTIALKERTEEDVAQWAQAVLAPLVAQRLGKLRESLEEKARAFVEKVDQLRLQVSVGADSSMLLRQDVSVLGRILAGAYTILTGDVLTGGLGVVLGGKAMVTTMAIQFAAGIVLFALGLVNPVALIAATILSILAGGFINLTQLISGVKTKVGEALAEHVVKQRHELAVEIGKKVAERLRGVSSALDAGLGSEIATVRGEVEVILAQKQAGKADAEAEIGKLKASEVSNRSVEERIDSLMQEAGLGIQSVRRPS